MVIILNTEAGTDLQKSLNHATAAASADHYEIFTILLEMEV
jgi:hypothetical protein